MRNELLQALTAAITAAPQAEAEKLQAAMNAYLQAYPHTVTAGVPLVGMLFAAMEEGLGYEGFAYACL